MDRDGREQIKIIMLITHLNPEVLKKNQSSSGHWRVIVTRLS